MIARRARRRMPRWIYQAARKITGFARFFAKFRARCTPRPPRDWRENRTSPKPIFQPIWILDFFLLQRGLSGFTMSGGLGLFDAQLRRQRMAMVTAAEVKRTVISTTDGKTCPALHGPN